MLSTFKSRLIFGYLISCGLWLTTGAEMSFGFSSDEEAITSTIWLLAGGGLVWFGLSLAFWASEPASGSLVERFAFPGSRGIARAAFVASIATTAACGAQNAPTLTYVGEASSIATSQDERVSSTSSTVNNEQTSQTSAQVFASTTNEITPLEQIVADTNALEDQSSKATGDETSDDDSHHTVVQGEHLWSIAISHLSQNQSEPSVPEVASYWRRLVDENRAILSSGNPNLIFPGEVLVLPD